MKRTILVAVWLCGCVLSYAQPCRGGSRGALDTAQINQFISSKQSILRKAFKFNKYTFQLELPQTSAQAAQGLMGRKSLKSRSGMIFYSDAPDNFEMTMEKTAIPLDMLFVGLDGRIACVIKNTIPFSKVHLSCKAPVMAVIELNAGEAEKYGLVVGLDLGLVLK